MRNIKHQQHCRELQLIRERVKEKKDARQTAWQEKKSKRMLSADTKERGEPVRKKAKPAIVLDEDESSCSEEEGWHDGLWMFKGTNYVEHEKAAAPAVPEENEISDDDGPPSEVKALVSYENFEEEESEEVTSEESKPKKARNPAKKKIASTKKIDLEPSKSNPIVHEAFIVPAPPSSPGLGLAAVADAKTDIEVCAEPGQENDGVPVVFKQRLRPPTLLERLLLSEIKKERNKILQCVRYVCKNNFFQDQSKS